VLPEISYARLKLLKFGQLLAMRRDLLPDAYIDELELNVFSAKQ
jgi:hypothetical protein